MNQFTWCAQVRLNVSSKILFGRIEAEERLMEHLNNQEYRVERYSMYGFRKGDVVVQQDVLS